MEHKPEASKFPISRSDQARMGQANLSPIDGGPTSQPTGLKGFTTNALMPDTTGHL